MPQRRDVSCKAPYGFALGLVKRGGLLGLEALELGLQLLLGLQRSLPLPLQRAHHQAVLRLDGVELPVCPLSFEASALKALLPMVVQPRTFGLHILDGLETDLQGRRLQRR